MPKARQLVATAAVMAVLATAGCAGSVTGVSAVPDPVGPHPVVLAPQAKGILDKVSAAAGSASSTGSTGPAGSAGSTGSAGSGSTGSGSVAGARLIGPEQQWLAASAKLPAKLRPAGPATDLSWQRLLVPAQTGWPRWFAAVGSSPGRSTPVIWVLQSGGARVPYGLWGELAMLPGTQLPEVARVDRGAPELAGDATGLVMSPNEVALRYADVLANGTGSPSAKDFAPDVFRDQVLRRTAGDRVQLLRLKGTVTSREVVQGTPLALRTADGGALVIAALFETYTVKVPADAGSVTVGDPVVSALAGRASFTQQVAQTASQLVAFTVPPASAGGQVRVVAAAKTHLTATGS
jgi:hypothetical protein